MATDALTIMKEKKESLRASSDKPSLQQEFYQSVNNQRKEEVSDEMLNTMIDERLRVFKEAWKKEKESEISKLKQLIDGKFEDIEDSVEKKQETFEVKVSQQIEESHKSNEASNQRIDLLESRMSDVLNKELKELQLIHNEKKSDSDINLAGFKEKVIEDQDKLRQDLKSEFNAGISQLQAEIKVEIEKLGAVSSEERKQPERVASNQDSSYEQSRDLVEDVFDMKMQSEMNQMKTRLREDFSREVMALEDEIEALRKSHDARDYTTDEGTYYKKEKFRFIFCYFVGLGKSMSRIRFTEGSSDDELDKLIKKREKRLQKRKRLRI